MAKKKCRHEDEVKAFLVGKQFETSKEAQWFFEKETGLECSFISFYRQYKRYCISLKKQEKVFEFLSNQKELSTARELYFKYIDTYKADISLIYFQRLTTQFKKRNNERD